MPFVWKLYLCVVAVFSVIAFVLYGWDKRQAQRNGRRIPEQTLHLCSLLGGWPGAILGQQTFRHKTKKLSFRITFWLTVFVHLSVIVVWWRM